jgi:hypothetical protein
LNIKPKELILKVGMVMKHQGIMNVPPSFTERAEEELK